MLQVLTLQNIYNHRKVRDFWYTPYSSTIFTLAVLLLCTALDNSVEFQVTYASWIGIYKIAKCREAACFTSLCVCDLFRKINHIAGAYSRRRALFYHVVQFRMNNSRNFETWCFLQEDIRRESATPALVFAKFDLFLWKQNAPLNFSFYKKKRRKDRN